ncbi:MAG: alpha-mannosidase, partial [Chloroflexi bacterium]|nr:alpha-mannosidase [Chloroflexota bacterium]
VLEIPHRRRFQLAQLLCIHPETERLYYLLHTGIQTVKVLDANDWQRVELLNALNAAVLKLDFTQPRSTYFYRSVADALSLLDERLAEFTARGEVKPTMVGVGHAHIDVAWLWRLSHSREKAARTFATALHLMKQYPEYHFLHSTPQLYKFLEHDYPELFAQVKERIASGQWEINGSMWVEPDINVPSGESLVRQIMFGLRYTRQKFGIHTKVLWLPDVFGYSWALPQLIVKSGLKYFMTSKISWNQYNRFPHDGFRWRGMDGTEVLTHFIITAEEHSPRLTYNGQMIPFEIKGTWDGYKQKQVNDELQIAFGWGDGGGGPTQEMIERARVMKDLPGLPRVRLGKAEEFFERLD